MKKDLNKLIQIYRGFRTILFYSFLCLSLACGGGDGSSSTPVSAPVSGLISVSSPDTDGNVTVYGSAGAVDALASVTVTNITTDPSAKELNSVLAVTTSTVTANSTGAFSTVVEGDFGASIQIEQSSGGQTSESTTFTVQQGTLPLSNAPVGVSVLEDNNQAIVGFTDGTDSFLAVYDLGSALQSTFTISNFLMTAFDMDESSSGGYAIDNSNGALAVVDSDGSLKGGSTLSVTDPKAVVADGQGNFGIVSHGGSSNSLTLIDNTGSSPSIASTLLISHPTNPDASHVETFALSMDQGVGDVPRIVALSLFSTGDTIFSFIEATNPPTSSLSVSSQVNLGTDTFGNVVLYDSARDALVSNRSQDQVVTLGGTDFATQSTINVGDDPRGIAVNEDEAVEEGFVVNAGDNTVTRFDLGDFDEIISTFTTTDGVGLGPIAIAIDESAFVLIIANQLSLSLSFIDVDG